VAIPVNLFRNGAVGFIDWLDDFTLHCHRAHVAELSPQRS
jgi:hypothetical protein